MVATDPSSHTESHQKMSYSKPGVTLPSPLKYKCAATGEKLSQPCATCNNSNNCMTDGLQIKEPTVDNLDEKSVVKLDADGAVQACAKGLDVAQCGYKPGAKVCGKCGAMAVQVKIGGADPEAENPVALKPEGDGGDYCNCDNPVATKDGMCENCGKPMPPDAMKGFMPGMADIGHPMDEGFAEKGAFNVGMTALDDPMDEDFTARRKRRHKKRLASMGMKMMDVDDEAQSSVGKSAEQSEDVELVAAPAGDLFLCGSTREIKSLAVSSPCDDCTGGCMSMDARPDLLEVEAMAEQIIGGKALYSGYADEHDMFAVQVRRDDGKAVEAFFTGDGELDGWLRIPESEVFVKGANVVDINTAVEAALGAVEGKAIAIAVGRLDDKEIYVVEVEGVDGKSYDVHVATEGKVLSFDERITETKSVEPEVKDEQSTEEKSAASIDAKLSAALIELELLELDFDEE